MRRRSPVLLVFLLLLPGVLRGSDGSLAQRLELAESGRVYLSLEGEAIHILVGVLTVQSLAVKQVALVRSQAGESRLGVARLVPGPPEVVVEACVGCDDTGGTVGLTDRIGIDAMPADFVVRFEDGSQWIVLADQGGWPLRQWRETLWGWRVLPSYLRSLADQGWLDLRILRLSPDDARALYWSLQPGVQVLQSSQP